MRNEHEPTDTNNKVPQGLDTTPSSQADGTSKSSRTAALRNRLGLRRNDGSPKQRSRPASGHGQATRDRPSTNWQSGGFLLNSPSGKSVASRTPEGARITSGTFSSNRSRGLTPTLEVGDVRISGSTKVGNGGGSSRSSTPFGSAIAGDASSEQRPSTAQTSLPSRAGANPAEIVGLALSLSDNRRRRSHLGAGHVGVNINPLAASHLIARDQDRTDQEALQGTVASANSKANITQQEDERAKEVGAAPLPIVDPWPHSKRIASGSHRDQASTFLPMSNASLGPPAGFVPSQATLKRVEKTKAALELAYHHRRVLQHLPELPKSKLVSQRPNTGNTEQRGRAYNPLQYIRNRRVRQREGCPLNPNKSGWDDVGRVQAWVNAVAEASAKDTRNTAPTKRLPPLPPYPQDFQSSYMAQGSSNPEILRAPRLRADWSASPAEMLADAHWIHESENRFMMLDREGSRLFDDRSYNGSKHERNGSLARPGFDHSKKFSLEIDRPGTQGSVLREELTPERGRKRDEWFNGKQAEARLSTSTDRRGKLRRNILRSTSPSARSEGSDVLSQPLTRGMQSMDEKDLQDVLLLRQQLRMLSQNAATGRNGSSSDQQVANGDGKEPKEAGEERFYDAASQYSTDDANKAGRVKQQGRKKHAGMMHRPSEGRGFDSGMSSDQEPEPLPRRILALPDISFDGEPSINPRSKLMDSALPLQPSVLASEIRSRDLSPDSVNGHDEAPTDLQWLQSPQRSGSDVNFSPSRSSLRQPKERRRGPHFSMGGSPRSNRNSEDAESRPRNFIRGSKLSGLVSTPANKVSDLLWRMTDSEHRGRPTTPTALDPDDVHEAKELEDEKNNPRQDGPTPDDDSAPENGSQPKGYHMDNLPVFKSPFKGNSNASGEESSDHISRQQQALRYRRSQSRFDKLAPPSLDLRSVSRSSSRPTSAKMKSRETSEEYQQPANGERRSAVVAGSPGNYLQKVSRDPVLAVGEFRLERWKPDSYMYAIARPDVVEETGKVTGGDVARLDTLMTSCAIQSNEILRWAGGNRRQYAPEANEDRMADCFKRSTGVTISRSLLGSISQNFTATREAMGNFSEDTVNDLHKQLQGLHQELSENLTGAVRNAEYAADDLGSQLALDCTLEVKRLNETVDIILRRRRRRSRWLRRTGFSLLEWAVLALMWMVWLVVVIFRTGKGIVRGVYWSTRWLLWL